MQDLSPLIENETGSTQLTVFDVFLPAEYNYISRYQTRLIRMLKHKLMFNTPQSWFIVN